MPTVARRRLVQEDQEQGFTLIELMVVVLIIAILIAIAIPTFLGSRSRANDRAAQSSLRVALTAAKITLTDTNDFSTATQATLATIEPSLSFVAGGASTGFKSVSIIAAPSGQTWWATALSKSGNCYGIEDSAVPGSGGTTYAGTTTVLGSPCQAPAADPGWTDTRW
jgi:type IV pilus assembly protein PilA